MLRATFFSAGLFVALWGTAFLFVDQIVLNMPVVINMPDDYAQQRYQQQQYQQRNQGFRGLFVSNEQPPQQPFGPNKKVLNPPDWAAFSLMSIGCVTMLYAAALPKKRADG